MLARRVWSARRIPPQSPAFRVSADNPTGTHGSSAAVQTLRDLLTLLVGSGNCRLTPQPKGNLLNSIPSRHWRWWSSAPTNPPPPLRHC